jgi:hypothetical protein
MRHVDKLTYDGLRAVLGWSPTGVVVYKTSEGGWSVRKDAAVLVNEIDQRPRVWKDLDRTMEQLTKIGAREVRVELA